MVLLAELPGELADCGKVSAACDACEESSEEEEGRGGRAGKEHPAEQVGEGEEEEGDAVAKPGSKLGGKENPKEDSEPEN